MDLLKEGLPKKLPVAVVDEDNSTTSCSLVRSLNTFAQTDVVMRTANFSEAREALQRGMFTGFFISRRTSGGMHRQGRARVVVLHE